MISRTFDPLIFKCKLGLLLLQYTSILVHVAARHMSKNVLYKIFPSILPNSLGHEWYSNTFRGNNALVSLSSPRFDFLKFIKCTQIKSMKAQYYFIIEHT